MSYGAGSIPPPVPERADVGSEDLGDQLAAEAHAEHPESPVHGLGQQGPLVGQPGVLHVVARALSATESNDRVIALERRSCAAVGRLPHVNRTGALQWPGQATERAQPVVLDHQRSHPITPSLLPS